MGLPAKKKVVPSVKMRQLQWNKIPNQYVEKTIWKDITNEDKIRQKIDLKEFETLFSQARSKCQVNETTL